MLQNFVGNFKVDLAAMARIRKRVFVVGRFNQSKEGEQPQSFLFTRKGGQSQKYLANFTRAFGTSYDSFVKALRPAIAERVDTSGTFPSVEQDIPRGDDALEGTSVIDIYNFFFLRAVGNTEQEELKADRPRLPDDLVPKDEKERGKAILSQIRRNLETFCTFQPRTHEIVDTFSRLLGDCGNENALPPYASGGALPGGFAERLVDYVYAEDITARFTLDGLDLGSPAWAKLRTSKEAQGTFCDIVTAYRDALQGLPDQFDLVFRGEPLSKRARVTLAGTKELSAEFQKARDAFNGLRQSLRSKVLLSMVLEWLMNAYYDAEPVRRAIAEGGQAAGDEAVGTILTTREACEALGWAPPVKRPDPEERRRFSSLLTTNFERLLKAVLASGDEADALIEALPGQLREYAREMRSDPEKVRVLGAVAGATLDPELHKAFVEASKTILLDVMCPVLYRDPKTDVQKLRQYFKEEVLAGFLTAVFLSDESQDAVRGIAEKHLEFFESKIDEETKRLADTDQIMKRLLEGFFGLLTKPEFREEFEANLQSVNRVLELLDKAGNSGASEGASAISAIYTSDKKSKVTATERTKPDTTLLTSSAVAKIATMAAAHAKTAGATVGTPSQAYAPAASTPSEPLAGAGTTAEAGTPEAAEPEAAPSELESDIDRIVGKMKPPKLNTPDELDKWKKSALETLLADQTFLEKHAANLKVFGKVLDLIYRRYVENPGKKTFRNKVERMTLVNMMLLSQKELGLGRVCSNLYELLLDLVLFLDPEKMDPMDFIRSRSLTQYFDDAKLAGGGITDLRQTLEVQSVHSLRNIVSFVSELRGMKYLLDRVARDPETEVVVVNATADEFLDWVQRDNLTPNACKGRLRAEHLVTGRTDECILPGLIYMTDIAFPTGGKKSWISRLSGFSLQNGGLGIVLPPICISTGPQDDNEQWIREGGDCAAAAENAPAAVVVLGPSPYMNPKGDGFPTVLPAGYLFCAHVLGKPEQRIRNMSVARRSQGRFRIVGYGPAGMDESLEGIVWGEADGDAYAFAADFYLFTVLTLLSIGTRYGGQQAVIPSDFYSNFLDNLNVMFKDDYRSSIILTGRESFGSTTTDQRLNVLGVDGLRFALRQDVSKEPLQTVWVEAGRSERTVDKVAWFNLARQRAGLP